MNESERFAKEPRRYLVFLSLLLGAVITAAIATLFCFESPGVLRQDHWQVAAIYIAASVVAGILLAR